MNSLIGWGLGRRLVRLSLCKIGLEILQAKRKLIVVDAHGPASELRALKLLDDQLEALDLTVAALDGGHHVAHQTVQKHGVGRQVFEIDPHVRFYFGRLLRPSSFALFFLDFRASSARHRGSPDTLRDAPVDAFDQHGELRAY
jgi:hypothetical protein